MSILVIHWEIDPEHKRYDLPFKAIKYGDGCDQHGNKYHKMIARIDARDCLDASNILKKHQPTARITECEIRL